MTGVVRGGRWAARIAKAKSSVSSSADKDRAACWEVGARMDPAFVHALIHSGGFRLRCSSPPPPPPRGGRRHEHLRRFGFPGALPQATVKNRPSARLFGGVGGWDDKKIAPDAAYSDVRRLCRLGKPSGGLLMESCDVVQGLIYPPVGGIICNLQLGVSHSRPICRVLLGRWCLR